MNWIKISDQLPQENEYILISNGIDVHYGHLESPGYIRHIKTKPYHFFAINEYCYPIEEFTHWMPLPEPPSET